MNTTSVCVFISKKFGAGAAGPVNAEAASLPPAAKTVDYHWPTLGDVIAAHQAQCADCERAVNDLERLNDPAFPQPMPPDPASTLNNQ
jgi:hypothetical protein